MEGFLLYDERMSWNRLIVSNVLMFLGLYNFEMKKEGSGRKRNEDERRKRGVRDDRQRGMCGSHERSVQKPKTFY
jgi:hypothetical protein